MKNETTEFAFGSFHVSAFPEIKAHVAQLAEHVLGKDEVTRSIRVVGSSFIRPSY